MGKRNLFVPLMLGLLLAGCLHTGGDYTGPYTGNSPVVQVLPTKGWRKPGVSGEDAWKAQRACAGSNNNNCMEDKGFTFGKLAPDQVFVPPPPPQKMWVKSGVGYVEASRISNECANAGEAQPESKLAKQRSQYPAYMKSYIQECMAKQGFVFRELKDYELPPCWYVRFPPCKDEPPPHQ